MSEHGRRRLVKIVRDRIGDFVGESRVAYEPATWKDAVDGLRAKLIEEAVEYLQDPSLGELADVLALVEALALRDLQVPFVEVKREADAKARERGGFELGIGMFVYTSAPARHEGRHASVLPVSGVVGDGEPEGGNDEQS